MQMKTNIAEVVERRSDCMLTEKNRVMVYNFEAQEIQDYTFADSIKAGIYEDLYIDFSKLPTQ